MIFNLAVNIPDSDAQRVMEMLRARCANPDNPDPDDNSAFESFKMEKAEELKRLTQEYELAKAAASITAIDITT